VSAKNYHYTSEGLPPHRLDRHRVQCRNNILHKVELLLMNNQSIEILLIRHSCSDPATLQEIGNHKIFTSMYENKSVVLEFDQTVRTICSFFLIA
jgi:hypothetical protein